MYWLRLVWFGTRFPLGAMAGLAGASAVASAVGTLSRSNTVDVEALLVAVVAFLIAHGFWPRPEDRAAVRADYEQSARKPPFTQTSVTYGWDGASNRTSAGTDSFTYDQRNRLVASPDGTHTHEARGTLASVGTTTYDFDALGRLTDADGIAYTYDSLDRIAERDNTAFTYNSPGRHPVSDGGHVWSRSPGGRLVAQDDGTNTRLVGLNRHGDLTYLYTTAGQLTDTVLYDPFGDPAATTGTTGSPLGFQGDYTDPHSTQVWMGARWYAPAHAVFTSRDTLQGELTTPVSLNRYTYAAANPMIYWDPDGRQAALIDDPYGKRTTNTYETPEQEAERMLRRYSNALVGTAPSKTAITGALSAVDVSEQRRSLQPNPTGETMILRQEAYDFFAFRGSTLLDPPEEKEVLRQETVDRYMRGRPPTQTNVPDWFDTMLEMMDTADESFRRAACTIGTLMNPFGPPIPPDGPGLVYSGTLLASTAAAGIKGAYAGGALGGPGGIAVGMLVGIGAFGLGVVIKGVVMTYRSC